MKGNEIKAQVAALQRTATTWLFGLSRREQGLVGGAVLVAIVSLVYMVVEPISSAFTSQKLATAQLEGRSRQVPAVVERYLKLKSRRDLIESRYREIEFKEGVLSHLENLIRTKAGIPSGFTIRNGQPRPFAANYEQVPFSIKFQTTNFPALVDFLRELIHGQRPLIVSRLDIQKPRAGTRLEVDLDVSSLSRKEPSATASVKRDS